MDPLDTDPEARRQQLAVYRVMTPQQRLEIAFELSETVRRIALDGIRSRRPDFDERQVHREWLRLLHGARLVDVLDRRPNE